MRLEEHSRQIEQKSPLRTRIGSRMWALAMVVALAGLTVLPAAAQDQTRYSVKIAPMPRDGRTASGIQGDGFVRAVLYPGGQLAISGSFKGLAGKATTVKLLESQFAGVVGKQIATLSTIKDNSGTLWGTVKLTPAQQASLQQHKLYIQLDSETATDGNLWGWLH